VAKSAICWSFTLTAASGKLGSERSCGGAASPEAAARITTTHPGPLRTFARLAPLQRSFPKPDVGGIVQHHQAAQVQQCGKVQSFD